MKKLNHFKKLLTLTVSAAMLALLPGADAITVSAAEPVTYYLMYSESDEDWRYQLGTSWDNDAQSTPSYYLDGNIKDGDVVIVGNGSSQPLNIKVRLSNLTISNPRSSETLAQVSVPAGIDTCIFNDGTLASVTGNVTNAHVFGGSLANFTNVDYLCSHELNSDVGPDIGVSGTVKTFAIEDTYGQTKVYGTNYKADTFRLSNGIPQTEEGNFTPPSGDGSPAPAATPAPTATPAPAQPSASQAPASSSASSDEYDKVPKTGEAAPVLWLSLAAIACISTSLYLKKASARQ